MNPQWNTPPNGDFAAYVERLSAQSALPRREHPEGEHGLDVGMTASAEPHAAAARSAAAIRGLPRGLAGLAAALREWLEQEARKQQQRIEQQQGRNK